MRIPKLKLKRKFLKRYFILRNRLMLTLNGVSYGSHVRIFNRIYLELAKDSRLSIGKHLTFTSGDGINPICRNVRGEISVEKGAEITIGNRVGISSSCLWARERITIGNNVDIGGCCIIMDSDSHSLDWRIRANILADESGRRISDNDAAKSAPITIEDHVWIGANCIILKGVTIGARSIVAAGSVVTKSIPSDCIAGGNPARIIRKLNP